MIYNRNIYNEPFDAPTVEAVWQKGKIALGYHPSEMRKDACGKLIRKSDYGNVNSTYGWEIDHIIPKAVKLDDNLSNLQPLHWQNNRFKSDNYPKWYCKLSA